MSLGMIGIEDHAQEIAKERADRGLLPAGVLLVLQGVLHR
jgi:hypothetical protein